MSSFVLFSLDVLMNMPRLYAIALDKALEGKIEHEEILERLADSNLDVLGIIREAYAEPLEKKNPERIGRILARTGYCSESLHAYRKFLDMLGTGAHNCVKDKTRELLRELKHVHTGVFYPMKEENLVRIVNNSKLDHRGIDIVAGFDPEKEIENVIRKAISQSHADRILLVTKDCKRSPGYDTIA
ncbi:MAG: hypothetical protein QW165_04375, partial [Candidatus Woesearchaeota archaeon]